FDGWLVFVDAAKRAMATGAKPGSSEFRAALRQALFTTKELAGTQGVYTYTPADRHGVDARARILVQIEDGNAGLRLLHRVPDGALELVELAGQAIEP
ncbi:ABC transporter substrate-binding protein, partial [Aduncisulcus paluster]